jgi:uncharacterized protein (DUF1778 family)
MGTIAPVKEERLYIRVDAEQNAKLAAAAQRSHTDTGQFVLQASLDAANAVLDDGCAIRMNPEAFDEFTRRLDEPARIIPELRELFNRPSTFHEW